ncbi:hypothetical protein MASR2M70_04420 [Bacillota bacterium]
MQKQWIFPEKAYEGNIINYLLECREVVGPEAVEEYLSPNPRLTYEPFLLKGMKEASERILSAIEKGERICIYGDYDADGVCGVSLLKEIFAKLGADYTYYIPSRFDEGYGLNKDAIKKIKERGTDLIVTVDCGSLSVDEVEYAKASGMDVIVTDHHNINEKPVSCILINPKQKDCPYPEKELSGCGVAFKLAQAVQRKRPDLLCKADLNRALDLVAIATVGDIVALTGENRTMVKYGLRVINSGGRPGLSLLIKKVGLKEKEIKSEHLAYVIVPHLNAAGRMVSASAGVRLLTSDKEGEIEEITEELLYSNKDRKKLQETAYDEAVSKIEALYSHDKFLVLELPDAHEGITGIVAGKLKDRFTRPAIILTPTGDNKLKGTGRSIDGVNLYDILASCGHLFDKFGGHSGACGFTMNSGNLATLRMRLKESADKIYKEDPSIFKAKLQIDAELDSFGLSRELIFALEQMEPFGHRNPKPVFAFSGVSVSSPYYMGERQQHVRFEANGVSCVFFNEAERFREYFRAGNRVDIAGYPGINRWKGNEKIQFTVEDMR